MATSSKKNTSNKSKVSKKVTSTHIKTIEKKYGKDFGKKTTDKKLNTFLKKNGYGSLTKLLKNG